MNDKPTSIFNNHTTLFFQVVVLLLATFLWSCEVRENENAENISIMPTHDTIAVEAPFDMPDILAPNFAGCPTFSITDFGAEIGDKEKITNAIANAIDAANKAGCGIVKVPAGEWLTGKIHFKSNVNLHLEDGATLLFSGEPQDYLPAVHTTWEGMECMNYSPLIYAFECENIAITGEGTLQAKLDTWIDWYGRTPAHLNGLVKLYEWAAKGTPVKERMMVADSINLRPHFIQFNRSKHIKLENITIKDSPFWVVHPYLSKDMLVRGVNIQALKRNNDGVDIDMTQNVLIENCTFDQGDDAVAVKSGRNQDAWRINTPTKNIVVRNCKVINGHQLLAESLPFCFWHITSTHRTKYPHPHSYQRPCCSTANGQRQPIKNGAFRKV